MVGENMNEFINIKLQSGDAKTAGINGCCIIDVLQWCQQEIALENKNITRKENGLILKKIQEAIDWVKTRNQNIELGK